MIKRDYLERLVEELAAITAKALGLARETRNDEARREIEAGYSVVGIPALVIERLDAASIRMMAGEKTGALIELLDADAAVSELRGDTRRAQRLTALRRALES